jgi:peptidoglycan glycosyltransferase
VEKSMRRVIIFFLSLFVMLGCYLTYIQAFQGSKLGAHALNRRNWEMSKTVPRGNILASGGETVARSVPSGAGTSVQYTRDYPYGKIFAPVAGFVSEKYGKAGIENTFNQYLSGIENPQFQLGPISSLWQRGGYNIVLSINADLQRTAYRALGEYRGAVIVMEPETGKILALVSKPSYDPEGINEAWKTIVDDPASPFLNRALQGLYPPGSAIKPLVAAAALEEGVTNTEKIYYSPGYLKIGNYTLHEINSNPLGKVNLEQAMALSSNVAFGQIGLDLGQDRLGKYFEKFGFNKELSLALPAEQSRLPKFNKLADGELAQTAIGQGELLVTPLSMALMTSAIANKGIMMKPIIVTAITNDQGQIIKSYLPEVWLKPISGNTAHTIQTLMGEVVKWGTGTAAKISGLQIAGKTGTAENPHGVPHAWFIGLAPMDKPKIVVVVIVENGGSGGAIATPIARRIFEEAF